MNSTSTEPARASAGAAAARALVIRDLSFAYPATSGDGDQPTRWSLTIPRLEIARAEQVLLSASSGAGKSTLLSLIAGLMDPDSGSVEIDGQRIHALRGAARDRFRGARVGVIFQTFNLLVGFSALENVMAALYFGGVPEREHASRAKELLSRLGITRAGALVERLSVGQQQRVAVARAMACRPALVLADEPTASLDPENAGVAMELVQGVCKEQGAALLCVSHDPSMTARFPRRESLAGLIGTSAAADRRPS
jgi:putative ABC transport system ATP-binding protein